MQAEVAFRALGGGRCPPPLSRPLPPQEVVASPPRPTLLKSPKKVSFKDSGNVITNV